MLTFLEHFRFSCAKRSYKKGFTLIELLVVSAIIVTITLFLLLRQSKFNSSTLLRSLTYSVALSVRQAQVYGSSILGTSASGSLTYASGYGLSFNTGSKEQYVLFADLNTNRQYDSALSETVQIFSFRKGYTISRMCAIAGATKECSDDVDPITSLIILFKRPNPDPQFYVYKGLVPVTAGYDSAYIQIKAADGTFRSVLVTTTGQIVVQAPGTLP